MNRRGFLRMALGAIGVAAALGLPAALTEKAKNKVGEWTVVYREVGRSVDQNGNYIGAYEVSFEAPAEIAHLFKDMPGFQSKA